MPYRPYVLSKRYYCLSSQFHLIQTHYQWTLATHLLFIRLCPPSLLEHGMEIVTSNMKRNAFTVNKYELQTLIRANFNLNQLIQQRSLTTIASYLMGNNKYTI